MRIMNTKRCFVVFLILLFSISTGFATAAVSTGTATEDVQTTTVQKETKEEVPIDLMAGVRLMIIGMLVVFVFLIVLVIVMSISSGLISLINKVFPEPVPESQGSLHKAIDSHEDIAVAIAIIKSINK